MEEQSVVPDRRIAVIQRSTIAHRQRTSQGLTQEFLLPRRDRTTYAGTETQLAERRSFRHALFQEQDVDGEEAPASPLQTLSQSDVNPFSTLPIDLPSHLTALLMDQSRCNIFMPSCTDINVACSPLCSTQSGHKPF